jgi:glutamate-1-semialdehyde aminotransferase
VALNRGVPLSPFPTMALFSPHTEADVDRHTQVLRDAVTALLS